MRKYSWLIALVAVFALAFVGFVSCKDDDNNNSAQNVTITFDANGGTLTGDATITIPKNGTIAESAAPTAARPNRVFGGWTTTADGTGTQLVFGTTQHADDTKYYAVWTTVTITFNAGEGTFTGGVGSGTSTRTMTIPTGNVIPGGIPEDVELDGYTLVEWNTQADGDGDTLEATTVHPANTTYHAIWEEDNPIMVLYDMQTDANLASLAGTGGGNRDGGLFNFALNTVAGNELIVDVDSDPKTLQAVGRTGTGQGIRLIIADLKALMKPDHTYMLEYGGIFGGAAGMPRLRLESGGSAVLVNTGDYDTVTGEFFLRYIFTEADFATWGTAASISLGNTTGNVDITYTTIRIIQFAPGHEPEAVIYDMQNCPWIAGLDGLGSTNNSNAASSGNGWTRTSYESGTTGVVTTTPNVTLHVAPRLGSSQGFRVSLTQMVERNLLKADHSYRIEFAGLLPTADRGRLRVETARNPDTGVDAGNFVIWHQGGGSGTFASFDESVTFTGQYLLDVMRPGLTGNGSEISFGTGGNVPLTYTKIRIIEIRPVTW
jgi:hypothetical protein